MEWNALELFGNFSSCRTKGSPKLLILLNLYINMVDMIKEIDKNDNPDRKTKNHAIDP
jgi:hypothetical protein